MPHHHWTHRVDYIGKFGRSQQTCFECSDDALLYALFEVPDSSPFTLTDLTTGEVINTRDTSRHQVLNS
jgi:hypothetical protein